MSDKKKEVVRKNEGNDQLNLFFTTSSLSDDQREKYSSTIELYDSIPKYHLGKIVREGDKPLKTISREFKHRKNTYEVKLIPGFVQQDNGKRKEYYLTKREEVVENMLIKFAVDGHAKLLDDELVVFFTLYGLAEALKKVGHGYSRKEIKEAIDILGSSQFILNTIDKVDSYKGNFITDIGSSSRNMADKGNRKMYVKFNSLVSRAIKKQSTRIINFDILMTLKDPLARLIMKRISHLFTQAHAKNPYIIKASTIIRDTGLVEYERFRKSFERIRSAWDELQDKKVIDSYEVEKIFSEKDKRKIVDAKYIVYISQKFVDDIILANRLAQDEIINLEGNNNNDTLLNKLCEKLEFSKKEAMKILSDYDHSFIDKNLSYMENYQNKIGNKKAFFISSLQKNYAGEELEKEQNQFKFETLKINSNNHFCYNKTQEAKFIIFLETLQKRVGASVFQNWFYSLSLLENKKDYKLGVTSDFYANHIFGNYYSDLKLSYEEVYKEKNKNVIIEVSKTKS